MDPNRDKDELSGLQKKPAISKTIKRTQVSYEIDLFNIKLRL